MRCQETIELWLSERRERLACLSDVVSSIHSNLAWTIFGCHSPVTVLSRGWAETLPSTTASWNTKGELEKTSEGFGLDLVSRFHPWGGMTWTPCSHNLQDCFFLAIIAALIILRSALALGGCVQCPVPWPWWEWALAATLALCPALLLWEELGPGQGWLKEISGSWLWWGRNCLNTANCFLVIEFQSLSSTQRGTANILRYRCGLYFNTYFYSV